MINPTTDNLATISGVRTFILVLLFCLGSGVGVFAQDFKNLRIGVDGTYPPFSHRNIDGEYSGLDIDFANALCKEMKSKCTFEQFSWDNLVPALRGKKIDMIVATLQNNDANRDLITLSDPYLKIPGMIVVRNDSILSGLEIEDLQDAQLGALNSSSHAEYLRVHFPGSHVKTFENEAGYYLELVNRQLDGIAGDAIVLGNWLKTNDGQNCCRILGTLPHDPQINGEGFAIATLPQSESLLTAINKALKSIAKSGIAAKIIRKHLPFLK